MILQVALKLNLENYFRYPPAPFIGSFQLQGTQLVVYDGQMIFFPPGKTNKGNGKWFTVLKVTYLRPIKNGGLFTIAMF